MAVTLQARWTVRMRALALFAGAVATALVMGSTPAQAASPDDERAQEWITMALSAYKSGRFLAAAQAFEKAHEIAPQPRLVWNIARSYQAAKAWPEAKKWFETFIAGKASAAKMAEAKKHLAEIDTQLAANRAAEEKRQAEEARNTELAAQRAKEREQAAKAAEAKRQSEWEKLQDERKKLEDSLREMREQAKKNAQIAKQLEDQTRKRREAEAREMARLGLLTQPNIVLEKPPERSASITTGGWVSLAFGVVLGGVGAFLFINGEGLRDDWQSAVDKANNGLVTDITRQEALSLEDDANLQQTLGVVGLSVGGAALVTGIILLAVGDPEPPKTKVSADVVDGGLRLNVGGRF